jgi:hypothetical protein
MVTDPGALSDGDFSANSFWFVHFVSRPRQIQHLVKPIRRVSVVVLTLVSPRMAVFDIVSWSPRVFQAHFFGKLRIVGCDRIHVPADQ